MTSVVTRSPVSAAVFALLATSIPAAAAAGAEGATLPPGDQAAILRLVCPDGVLERDGHGLVCRVPDTDDFGEPWGLRWVSARRGRFVTHADDWLVSLSRACIGGICPGHVFVVRKVDADWRVLHEMEIDEPLGDQCVPLRGMPDGFDRLVCLSGAGPHQGFMSERLAVLSFADGEVAARALMSKEQGGECFLSPPGREYAEDTWTFADADQDPAAAVLIRAEVRRAACDPGQDEGHGLVAIRSSHLLRFVRQGNEVVPDAASAAVIRAQDWMPAAETR